MILRLVGLAVVLGVMVVAFTPAVNIVAQALRESDWIDRADAIVVLGGGLQPDGSLTDASLRRAVHGIVLYRRQLGAVIVFLGPSRRVGPPEDAVRAALARNLGVAEAGIVTVTGASTTWEEVERARGVLAARGARRVLVVTDSQHMYRARWLFERAGFQVLAAPVDEVSSAARSPEDRLRLARRVGEELAARLYYRALGQL